MKPVTIVIALGPPSPEALALADELRRLARKRARERGLIVRTRRAS